MAESLGNKAAKGAVWATIDRFGTMGLQFIVNLILARLLFPADFGAIGMITIFISVSQVIIDGGFASALIQKKVPTQTDYSTIFYWNLGLSASIYLIIFAISPFVSEFFKMPVLCDVLRVLALSLIAQSILALQVTRLRKVLAFKKIAVTNIAAYVAGGLVGVVLAYSGFGVWSLVAMQISIYVLSLVIYFVITRWLPSMCFSMATMKELFSFGGFIMAANLLQSICQNLQGIIIGRKFSAAQMGYYSQAYKLDHVCSYSIPQIIVSVMYPVYSSLQDELERLRKILLMNIRVLSFLIFPLMGLLIVVAEPLIVGLYGDKWLQSVPYFRILCVGGIFVCLQNVNFYAVAAVGRSKALFYWSFYKWGFLLSALLIGMIFGMYGILWGMVSSSVNIFLTNSFLTSKYVGLPVRTQVACLLPVMIVCLLCTGIAYMAIHTFGLHPIASALLFIVLYLTICRLSHLRAVSETQAVFKRILKKNRI